MAAAVAPLLNIRALEPLSVPAVVGEAPPRPCLIVNPRSFRASRAGLAAEAMATARAHGADVLVAQDAATLAAAVESVLRRRQREVIVLAGDGTVHAIVDRLAQEPQDAWIPDLLVLPGGRSNLTAADLVPRGRALQTLVEGLRRAREGRWDEAVEERVTLRIEQSPQPARHGFFVGAALVDSVVRRCHEHRLQGRGPMRTGHLSTAWCLLRLFVLGAAGRSGLSCPPMQVDAAACGRLQGRMRVVLVTTLHHATGWFNPYAARGRGDVRVTAVALHATRFWRSLPRLLTQRFAPWMDADHGYLSGRCERLELLGVRGYSLDGEKFDADPAGPVVVMPGRRLRFLSL